MITKPWNDDELRATIRQAFDHADLKAEIKRLNRSRASRTSGSRT